MSSPNSPVETNTDTGVNADTVPATPVNQKRGAFYWFFKNTFGKTWESAKANKRTFFVLGLAGLWFTFVFRAYWQPLVIKARVHTPEMICLVSLLALMVWSLQRRPHPEAGNGFREAPQKHRRYWKTFFGIFTFTALNVWAHFTMELPPLRYLTLYLRYQALDPVVLTELPTTEHERIQPQASIRVLGGEAMIEVERVSDPDFVRIGDEFRWTMAVEPANPGPRIFGGVKQILSVSGGASSPNFSGENRIAVSFRVAEEMYLGKSTDVAVTRSFGLLRFFGYSPRDVKYVKDDNGEWVQVVSLIKWNGVFFVWPEFGGVQVVRQGRNNPWLTMRSWFLGDGEWVKPEDIHKHKFLSQQNTVPYEVSRYAALSLRFQNSFWSPVPWIHKGDIRIPDLPGDLNDQPFTTYFRFGKGSGGSVEDKLYHYFALEPYGYYDKKQGLNTSVFLPADGVGKAMVYKHYRQSEALTGVSAIAPKVMESNINADWSQSRPVEHRPWIKDIDGKRRFFWFTNVVTFKDKENVGDLKYIAGSTPKVMLTDALYKNVVWVNPNEPSKWTEEVREKLGTVWKSN